MMFVAPFAVRALRPAFRRRSQARRPRRPALDALEPRTLLAAAPVLAPQSDTGISDTDGITRDNGSSSAPLTFDIPSANAALYYNLYDVTNPASPVLLAGPAHPSGSALTVSNHALADGVYQIAYTSAATSGGTPSALSQADKLTIESSLHVVSVAPATLTIIGQPTPEVVTFSGYLAGMTGGTVNNPFAVTIVPSGPDGGALYAKGESPWTAPSGVDSGDVPIPAGLIYQPNANGTSTITVYPAQFLSVDDYLVSVSGSLSNLAGSPLTSAGGQTGTQDSSFIQPTGSSGTLPALAVTSVTADQGAIVINNDMIPQPDTISIAFNNALDTWTVNASTIHLVAKTGANTYAQVPVAVAYSPTAGAAEMTPEAPLLPGTIYYVQVDTSVSDASKFPATGGTLAHEFYTSFTVNGPGVGAGKSPLTVTATSPASGTVSTATPLGYVTVTFSEPINLAALSRYSVMLIPQTGGPGDSRSGYADVPLNAKLAFNPNTNQLIIVPTTGYLPSGRDPEVYLIALSGITATNGDKLGSTPVYRTFGWAPHDVMPATGGPIYDAAVDTNGGHTVAADSALRAIAANSVAVRSLAQPVGGPLANDRPRGWRSPDRHVSPSRSDAAAFESSPAARGRVARAAGPDA